MLPNDGHREANQRATYPINVQIIMYKKLWTYTPVVNDSKVMYSLINLSEKLRHFIENILMTINSSILIYSLYLLKLNR